MTLTLEEWEQFLELRRRGKKLAPKPVEEKKAKPVKVEEPEVVVEEIIDTKVLPDKRPCTKADIRALYTIIAEGGRGIDVSGEVMWADLSNCKGPHALKKSIVTSLDCADFYPLIGSNNGPISVEQAATISELLIKAECCE